MQAVTKKECDKTNKFDINEINLRATTGWESPAVNLTERAERNIAITINDGIIIAAILLGRHLENLFPAENHFTAADEGLGHRQRGSKFAQESAQDITISDKLGVFLIFLLCSSMRIRNSAGSEEPAAKGGGFRSLAERDDWLLTAVTNIAAILSDQVRKPRNKQRRLLDQIQEIVGTGSERRSPPVDIQFLLLTKGLM